jgi:cytoskeletal protein RodZ
MNKMIIISLTVLAVALLFAGGLMLGYFIGRQEAPSPSASQMPSTTQTQKPTLSTVSTSIPANSIQPALTTTSLPASSTSVLPAITTNAPLTTSSAPRPTGTTAPSSTTSQAGYVKFEYEVTNVTGSGFTRTVSAQLKNSGTMDAHNVWVRVSASSGGSVIKMSGQNYLRVDIGTLKAASSVIKQVELSLNLVDALKVSQQGVRMEMTIVSDEYSETVYYDYLP